jgi:hypothetical protein
VAETTFVPRRALTHLFKVEKPTPQIIRNLAPGKPASQRYPHRFFAKFIRPDCAHGSSPLLHNM